MEQFKIDLILDRVYANELFVEWIRSDGDYDYIEWLRLRTMHMADRGGASNIHMDKLKKTIMVLIDAEREDVAMGYECLSNIKKTK